MDLALLGAGWDKDRAAELRGAFSAMFVCRLCLSLAFCSSIFVGVYHLLLRGTRKPGRPPNECKISYCTSLPHRPLTNPALCVQPEAKPQFKGIFTSSYGLNREQLEELNFLIRSSDPIACESNKKRVRPPLLCTRIHSLTAICYHLAATRDALHTRHASASQEALGTFAEASTCGVVRCGVHEITWVHSKWFAHLVRSLEYSRAY